MKIPSAIRILLKALLVPLIAVFFLNQFNVFEYITFVPEDYKFDVGLTLYLAILEALAEILEHLYSNALAEVECIFFQKAEDINIKNTPVFVCSDQTAGVTSISCKVQLKGNVKRLKNCRLSLELPNWLTSQIPQNSQMMLYSGNTLIWKFDTILSANAIVDEQSATVTTTIPLIRTKGDEILTVVLQPELLSPIKHFGVKLTTNSVKIQNRG